MMVEAIFLVSYPDQDSLVDVEQEYFLVDVPLLLNFLLQRLFEQKKLTKSISKIIVNSIIKIKCKITYSCYEYQHKIALQDYFVYSNHLLLINFLNDHVLTVENDYSMNQNDEYYDEVM